MKSILLVLLSLLHFSLSYTSAQSLPSITETEFNIVDWFGLLEDHYATQNVTPEDYHESADSASIYSLATGKELYRELYFYLDSIEIVAIRDFDFNVEEWFPSVYSKYTYNKEGLMIAHSLHRWDGVIDSWDDSPYLTHVFNYDEENKLISRERFPTWTFIDNAESDIEIYDYHMDQMLSISYYAVHPDGSYTNISTFDLNYKEDKLDHIFEYIWRDNSWWSPYDSISYHYIDNQLIKSDYHTYWFFQNEPIEYRGSYDYMHDEEGRLEEVNYSTFYDTLTQSFKRIDKFYFNYLPSGSLESWKGFIPSDNEDQGWNSKELSFVYDEAVDFGRVRYPRSFIAGFNQVPKYHKIKEFSRFEMVDYGTGDWEPVPIGGRRHSYHYSEIKTNTIQVEEGEAVMIYPNPVTEQLYFSENIKVDRLSIISLDGKLIKQVDNFEGSRLKIEELEAGTYLIEAIHKEGNWVRKFIKR